MKLFPTIVIALLLFMVLDVLTGIIAGARNRRLSSRISYQGTMKKAGTLIVVATCYGLDVALQLGLPLGQVITTFFLLSETISILENAGRLGVKLPAFLLKMVSTLQQSTEAKMGGEVSKGKDDSPI